MSLQHRKMRFAGCDVDRSCFLEGIERSKSLTHVITFDANTPFVAIWLNSGGFASGEGFCSPSYLSGQSIAFGAPLPFVELSDEPYLGGVGFGKLPACQAGSHSFDFFLGFLFSELCQAHSHSGFFGSFPSGHRVATVSAACEIVADGGQSIKRSDESALYVLRRFSCAGDFDKFHLEPILSIFSYGRVQCALGFSTHSNPNMALPTSDEGQAAYADVGLPSIKGYYPINLAGHGHTLEKSRGFCNG